ncbi:hypothetical protein ACYOEI_23135 [Singulisphaera rosea]
MWRRCFPAGCVAVTILLLGGCGDSGTPYAESSMQETSVKGVVKVHGKLLDGGEIHFNPANSNRKVGGRDAPIGKDGTYSITTLLGQNMVTISPPKNKKKSKAFFGIEYEEKNVVLNSGENTQDFDFLP